MTICIYRYIYTKALYYFQMAPRLRILMSSESKKMEPRYSCECEAMAWHSHKMWYWGLFLSTTPPAWEVITQPHYVKMLSQGVMSSKKANRVHWKCDGTRWRTGGEAKGNWRMQWVASALHTTSDHGVSSITTADAHTSAASSRLSWRPRQFKWARPFRRKAKSGLCACAITFQLACTNPGLCPAEGQ